MLAGLDGIQMENVLGPLVPDHQLVLLLGRAVLQPAPLVNADLMHVFFVWQSHSATHVEGTLGSLRGGGS